MDASRMQTEATGLSLSRLAERTWEVLGDEQITVFEGERWSAAKLGERSRRVASGLQGIGVKPGDRVVICMANCLEVGITYHAVWRMGGVVTPVLFLLTESELRHVISDSGAAAVVTTPEFYAKVAAAAGGIPVIVAGAPIESAISYDELAHGDEAALVDVDPTTPAALMYTGGTTGRSKGVVLSHNAMSTSAWAAVATRSDEDLSTTICPLPMAHAYGLLVATMALHATDPSTFLLMRWFEPTAWLTLAAQEKAQTAALVPTMIRLILDQPVENYDLSALRWVSSGSAPLPAEVAARWHERLPNAQIGEGYGCTETAALVSTTPFGQPRAGSVGKPVQGVEVRIDPLTPGVADGEICVRGPMLLTGYWNSPEETSHALRDGWFHTGDVGHLDDDGYLFVVDRIKDVIIRNGINVYPRDVEEAMVQHPDVATCAVVGRPDERAGEEPVAFVQLRPGATVSPAELVAFAKQHLSAAKYPREVRIVDAVPLTSIGKLDRKALRAGL